MRDRITHVAPLDAVAVALQALSRLFGRSPQQGYVYVADGEPDRLSGAEPGHVVSIPGRAPPWIVVCHDLDTVIATRWPGRLWQVELVRAASARDLAAAGSGPVRADAGYTRATDVRVLGEVPVSRLFGTHGDAVCAVIAVAHGLSRYQAGTLAAIRHADAGKVQTRLWKAWLARERPGTPLHDDYDGTLAAPGAGAGSRSPVGCALTLLEGEVGRRATVVAGPGAWRIDEADPESAVLAEPWSTASLALIDAVLAFGARELLSDADRDLLMTPWRTTIGPDPA